MTPDQWQQVTGIFHQALARAPAARDAFLDDACGGDGVVRAEVDRLLAGHDAAARFGDTPLPPVGITLPRLAALPSIRDTRADAAQDHETSAPPVETPAAHVAHPFRWLVAAAALMCVSLFTEGVWRLATTRGATAAFGWSEVRRDGGWVIGSVAPQGPAAGRLLPGDRIVSFDGLPPLARPGTAIYRRAASIGQPYHLEIDRLGERTTVPLTVGEGRNALATRLTYFIACLVWCSVGLFIGWARPANPAARLAFGAAVTTGLAFLNAAVLERNPLFHPMHVVLGYHFFSRFATGAPAQGIWRALLVAMYVVGSVPFLLTLWLQTTLLVRGVRGVAELMMAYGSIIGLRPPLASTVFYASLVLMVAVVARTYRQLTSEDQRRRVRWVAYGSSIGLTPQIVLSAAGLAGRPGGEALWTFANVFTVLIPIAVAYAVVRHRVFDIRVVVRRTVQYLLARRVLQAAAALPAVALTYTIVQHRHLTIAELTADTRGYLFWIAAAALVLRYRRPIERALDRRFFREEHDREQLLVGMLAEVGTVDSIAELSRLVSDRLQSVLHPRCAFIWYRDPEEQAVASSSDPAITPPDVPSGSGWLQWLERRGCAVELPLPADAALEARERRWFSARGVTLIVPVTDSDARLVGALLLGAKQSDEPYTAADRRLLAAIATQAAVVRETLRLRARVSEEVRVRHDVLARLDGGGADLLRECPACGACSDGTLEHCTEDGAALVLSLPVPRTIDRKYRLDRLIGRGGMGAVYDAHDLRLARQVAIKIVVSRAFGETAALARFRREARAAARLSHPNIVSVHDFGLLEREGAYLVMERVHGATLRAELAHRHALPPPAIAAWFGPLLDGLSAAHAAGIVHRDVKPENVIGWRDEDGFLQVKLLDLGLVKLRPEEGSASTAMTLEGVVMGTPGYMSPEQLAGRDVDERTDVFAVGVMLREALTGERPARHDTPGVPAPDTLAGGLGLPAGSTEAGALHDLLCRSLAVHPAGRIGSAAALRAELIQLLHRIDDVSGSGAV